VKLSWEQLEAVEDAVIETIMSTVLRLPEMNFRSFRFTKVTLHCAAYLDTISTIAVSYYYYYYYQRKWL